MIIKLNSKEWKLEDSLIKSTLSQEEYLPAEGMGLFSISLELATLREFFYMDLLEPEKHY